MIYTNRTAHTALYICFQSHHFISHSHIPFKNEKDCSFGAMPFLFIISVSLCISFFYILCSHNDAPVNTIEWWRFFAEISHDRVTN